MCHTKVNDQFYKEINDLAKMEDMATNRETHLQIYFYKNYVSISMLSNRFGNF